LWILTDQGGKCTDDDVSEGVQQHDQDTGPEQPITGRRVLEEDLWVPEAQAGHCEERELLGNGL